MFVQHSGEAPQVVPEQVAGVFPGLLIEFVVVPGDEYRTPGQGAFEGTAAVLGDDVFHLNGKGDIAPGCDADLVLVDPNENWVVQAQDSPSTQGYTPFEGIELTARVKQTWLRGRLIYDGNIVGEPAGKFLKRPY